jgi:hypothetical protein
MAKQKSNGKCNFCNGIFSKSAMSKHLESCKQRKGASETKSPRRGGRKIKSFHLVVEGRYLPEYWIHLEVPASASFKVLDSFLRQIWLECCGHMSAFTVAEKRYSVAPMADFDEEDMSAKLGEVLQPGMKFYHEYDFGSTTHLALKVVSEQENKIKGKSILVLARNEPPPITCTLCGKMATHVCTECLYSGEGWLCDQCAAEHKCGEDMLLPVVNSPRVGTCGYTGD